MTTYDRDSTQAEPRLILLRELSFEIAQCLLLQRVYATGARSAGATWKEIGDALGISKQSAFRRYHEEGHDGTQSGRKETSESTN